MMMKEDNITGTEARTASECPQRQTTSTTRRTATAARTRTTSINGGHWWKVCWFYNDNRNLLFNTATVAAKYGTLPAKLLSSSSSSSPSSASRIFNNGNDNNKFATNNHHCDNPARTSTLPSSMDLATETTSETLRPQREEKTNDEKPAQNGNAEATVATGTLNVDQANDDCCLSHDLDTENNKPKKMFRRRPGRQGFRDDMSLPLMVATSSSATNGFHRSMAAIPSGHDEPLSLPFVSMTGQEQTDPEEMARFYGGNGHQFFMKQLITEKIAAPLASWTSANLPASWCRSLWLLNQRQQEDERIVRFLIQYKGSDWRANQLEYQMPRQDEELFHGQQQPQPMGQHCAAGKFIRNKRRKALVRTELSTLTQTESCQKCKQEISAGVHCVRITLNHHHLHHYNRSQDNQNVDPHRHFHIDCFTCYECQEILVDLRAYLMPPSSSPSASASIDHHLYCSRHFVELFKPRCPSCQKLIFDDECTEAEGKAWHIGHFCCSECRRSLGGQQYIMSLPPKSNHEAATPMTAERQMPYCLTCFDILFGELCEECGELIGCEVGAIVHEGRSWHADDRCFRCCLCLKSLMGKPFLPALDGRIYCSIACSQAMIAHRKKRLKKQNKLQTLHTNPDDQKLIAEKNARYSEILMQQEPQPEEGLHQKQNHENEKKSSVAHDDQQQKLPEKSFKSDMNLTQVLDYVEFIKKNNQCFTSKYDWSKEQEFLSVMVDSGNENSSTSKANNNGTGGGGDHSWHDHPGWVNEFHQKPDIVGHHPRRPLNSSISSNSTTASQQAQQQQLYLLDPSERLQQQQQTSPPPEYCNIDQSTENSSNSSFMHKPMPTIWPADNPMVSPSAETKRDSQASSNPSFSGGMIGSENHKPLDLGNHFIDGQQPSPKLETATAPNMVKSKSVSFDPSIKEKSPRLEQRTLARRGIPLARPHTTIGSDDFSDDDSCSSGSSSCSTCSGSSSDDEDLDDLNFDLQQLRMDGSGRSKLVSKTSNPHRHHHNHHHPNNESCTIS